MRDVGSNLRAVPARSSKRVSGASSLPVISAARLASGYVGLLKRHLCRSVNRLPEVRPPAPSSVSGKSRCVSAPAATGLLGWGNS